MPQLHGKQIAKKTITQEQLSLQTPQSTDLLSGATVEYVNNMAGTNVIGNAEYTEEYDYGIYTDFTKMTRTGVAVDRFNQLFLKLAPTPPSVFQSSSLNITSQQYLSRNLGSGDQVYITTVNNPIFSVNIPNNGLSGSESGILSFSIDGDIQESVDVSLSDIKNTGVIRYTSGDPYDEVQGKEGFWNSFLSLNNHSKTLISNSFQKIAKLEHSEKGELITNFYIDDPLTTSITNLTIGTLPTMDKYISGVPTLSSGSVVDNISFTINNISSYFYAANYVWEIQDGLVTQFYGNPDTKPTSYAQSSLISNKSTTIKSNVFSDNNFYFNIRSRNSIGQFGDVYTFTDNTKRVDTVSNETIRKTSGSGNYPSTGWGGLYDSSQSLVGTYNNELMLKNGIYQYPVGNYTQQGGPNYSSITGVRWVTFTTLGVFNNNSSFTLNFIDSQGITKKIEQYNLFVEIKISGSTYWVNGNKSYSGTGDPGLSNDDDGSVVFGASTPTSRRITFGTKTYSGSIVIRIGITNNNITFKNITITNIV